MRIILIRGEVLARNDTEAHDKVRKAVHAYAGREVDYDIQRWVVEDASETMTGMYYDGSVLTVETERLFKVFWEADINWNGIEQ